MVIRVGVLLGVGLLTVSACTTTTGAENRLASDDRRPEAPSAVQLAQPAPGERESTPSALADMTDPRFPEPLLDPDLIVSGGPPPDGIPALDEPRFERAATVGWLSAREPVLSLTVGEETRAYPLQVMTWHEIVNDTVGGVPVAVTYCPLCNSGVAFERRASGRLLSFGTSGRLYSDNLVMYDRQTHSLWPQLTGQAAVGVLTGTELTAIPIGTVAWRDFKAAHPHAWVLSRDTGHSRPYGQNPDTGYDDPNGDLLFDTPSRDARLPVKARVVGVSVRGNSVALLARPSPRTASCRSQSVAASWWCGISRVRHRRWTPPTWPAAATSAPSACSTRWWTAAVCISLRPDEASATGKLGPSGMSWERRSPGHWLASGLRRTGIWTRSGSPGLRSSPGRGSSASR